MSRFRSPPRRFTRRALIVSVAFSASTILLIWLYFSHDALGPASVSGGGRPGPLSGLGGGKAKDRPLSNTITPSEPTPSTTTESRPGVASAPAVTLRQGTYIGATIPASDRYPEAIEAFRGIPFAQDTGGANRFRPPMQLAPSSRTFDATSFGQICPAASAIGGQEASVAVASGENCLNVNVYRPLRAAVQRRALPVVVYVHGGGFNIGSGSERNMASFVTWAEHPVIGVSFNYRVGPLGFLPSAVAAREGILNLGLRDQQMLFDWVQENIRAFGGDPENVTLMGLSAGAHSVGHHIMFYGQPAAPPAPFAKAILESGATTARSTYFPTHPRHLIQFREFLIKCDLEGVAEEELMSRLREIPLSQILKAARAVWDKYSKDVTWPFQPVIDGPNAFANSSHADQPHHFVMSIRKGTMNTTAVQTLPLIPDLPISMWRKGHFLRIPILTGFNTNEGAIFAPSKADTNTDFRAFFKRLIPGFSEEDLDELERLYPDPVSKPDTPYVKIPASKGKQWGRLEAAYGEYAYICPVLQTAHFLSTASTTSQTRPGSVVRKRTPVDWDEGSTYSSAPSSGHSSSSKSADIYVYNYAAVANNGVSNHGDQTPVVTHNMETLAQSAGLQAVSDAMHGAWVRFVASKVGSPNIELESYDNDGDMDPFKATTGAIVWPVFLSPFKADETLGTAVMKTGPRQVDTLDGSRLTGRSWFGWGSASKSGEGGGDGKTGRLLVFGAGNNERVKTKGRFSGSKKGTPAKSRFLSEAEIEACRFWWSRAELSEGIGNRSSGFM